MELFEKINETVEQGKVKKQQMKNQDFKNLRKVIQTKFQLSKVENFDPVETEKNMKPEPIVGQLLPSGK